MQDQQTCQDSALFYQKENMKVQHRQQAMYIAKDILSTRGHFDTDDLIRTSKQIEKYLNGTDTENTSVNP